MDIKLVGIVGAGVMGRGISQDLAQTGIRVILLDVSNGVLEQAEREISNNIRLQSLFTTTGKVERAHDVLEHITFSTDYQLLSNVDFLVENVTEKWEIKKEAYMRLEDVCPEQCVFATNTSAIPITRIASVTNRAEKVIGIHFMNPVPLIATVEVIRGVHTSDETVEITRNLLAKMGKECIIVNDSPGFVSNRVLMLAINEAVYLLQEQVASAEEIDKIFKTCFGHKMGPLETADLIGLDTVLYSLEVLYESFSDSKYRPCPLLRKLVDAGMYGRKSAQGFHAYPVRHPSLTNEKV